MKINWKQHELILMTAWAITSIIKHYIELNQVAYKFVDSLNYWNHLIYPRIWTTLLFFSLYLSIVLFLEPLLSKIIDNETFNNKIVHVCKAMLLVVVLGALLAIGVNGITQYVKPHLVEYTGFSLLALLGYAQTPIGNYFRGWDRAIMIVLFICTIISSRQLIIKQVYSLKKNKEFWIKVINQSTLLILFVILYSFSTNNSKVQLLTLLPIVLLHIYLTYFLFQQITTSLWDIKIITKILLAILIVSIPFKIEIPVPIIYYKIYLLVLLLVVTPASYFIYLRRKEHTNILRGLSQAVEKSSVDLQFLKSQINPHFLFNVLNTLYGTALMEKSEKTATGIQKLGDMMRFMLHENNQDLIPLSKEIEYLKNYIDLQRMRIVESADRMVSVAIQEQGCMKLIAPMLLVPFVENAFKHGISQKEKSWIKIKLSCIDSTLQLEVTNSKHKSNGSDLEKDNSGIGLQNVKSRLDLIYPEKYSLDIHDSESEFQIKLSLITQV